VTLLILREGSFNKWPFCRRRKKEMGQKDSTCTFSFNICRNKYREAFVAIVSGLKCKLINDN
jgi:hypothetical protein